jgi:periplasmic divalent cation tolerance protein
MDSLASAERFCMVYITAGSQAEAEAIARTVVAERLAACVNVLGPGLSIYRWQGAVEEAQEIVLIAKTRRDRADALAARVAALHSYDTPCIVTYPMLAGAPGYLAWLTAETEQTD